MRRGARLLFFILLKSAMLCFLYLLTYILCAIVTHVAMQTCFYHFSPYIFSIAGNILKADMRLKKNWTTIGYNSLFPAHQSQTKYFRKTFRQMFLWPHQFQKTNDKKSNLCCMKKRDCSTDANMKTVRANFLSRLHRTWVWWTRTKKRKLSIRCLTRPVCVDRRLQFQARRTVSGLEAPNIEVVVIEQSRFFHAAKVTLFVIRFLELMRPEEHLAKRLSKIFCLRLVSWEQRIIIKTQSGSLKS